MVDPWSRMKILGPGKEEWIPILINFEATEKYFCIFCHFLTLSWQLPYKINTRAADALATHIARASAALVLTQFFWNIPGLPTQRVTFIFSFYCSLTTCSIHGASQFPFGLKEIIFMQGWRNFFVQTITDFFSTHLFFDWKRKIPKWVKRVRNVPTRLALQRALQLTNKHIWNGLIKLFTHWGLKIITEILQHFQMHFLEGKHMYLYFDSNFTEVRSMLFDAEFSENFLTMCS